MSTLPTIADRDLPLLFVDDAGLTRTAAVTRVFHPGATRSDPVLVADDPGERGRVYLYGSVFHDRAAHCFRLWYGTPKPSAVAVAVSSDGLRWYKPAVGGADAAPPNRVRPGLHSPSLLDDGPEEPSEKRFKMLGIGSGGAHAAWSADGIHWNEAPGNPVFESDDTLTLARHPLTREYLAYHKRQEVVRGFLRRTVWVSGSWDFKTWSPSEPAFFPGEEDDRWAGEGQRTDVYSMSVFPHATGLVGWPLLFRVIASRPATAPHQSPDDGPIDVGLTTSRDGRLWHRPPDVPAMIPRGVHGDFDRGAILGVANTPVHEDGESWIYYTALNTSHGAPMPPKKVTIGRAVWRLHGFASLTCGSEPGRVVTEPLRLPSSSLCLNADAGRGRVRYGIAEADGTPLPGFSLAECRPLVGADATAWNARWNGGERPPQGRPLRLEFELTDAALFSVYGAS